MKAIYYVSTDFYGGFTASKTTTERFDTIAEAWAYYVREKSYDFDYGDSYHYTREIGKYWDTTVPNTGRHKCATKPAHKAKVEFDAEELAYLRNLAWNPEDEEILV